MVGVDIQEGRKAYLFHRAAWDPVPGFGDLVWTGGQYRISLTNLILDTTVVVERATSLMEGDPGDWTSLVTKTNIVQPEDGLIVEPTNLVEFLRMRSVPGWPDEP